jgi:hypothetical protein
MRTSYSMRMLYSTSLLTESQTFLKSMNSWCTVSLYSHFFSSIWWMQKLWSVVDLLHRNTHWWSPTISSICGLNLEIIFDNILYEFHNSDIPRSLLQSVLSRFLWIGTIIDSFHWWGRPFLFQVELMSLWIADTSASPPAWISSAKNSFKSEAHVMFL